MWQEAAMAEPYLDHEEAPPKTPVQLDALLFEPIRALPLEPPVVLPPTATLAEAVETLQQRHVGCVLITGPDKKLQGLFTERDLLNRVAGRRLDWGSPVTDFMTRSPETLRPEDRIAWALHMMHVGGYRNVPLTDAEGKPVGLVSVKDIVAFIVDLFPAAVLNLPPDPHRAPDSDTSGGGAD